MRHFTKVSVISAGIAWSAAAGALAHEVESSLGPLTATAEVTELDEPWGFDFLPGGGALVTERGGRLLFVAGETRQQVSNLPDIVVDGQGGLLDVMVPADFAQTREVYLTYAKPQFRRKSGTALYRARLSENGRSLEDGEVIFEIARGTDGGFHFGSRVVEGADGLLYMTIGDRGNGDLAQDLSMHNGSVVRIARDGSVPADNPFVDTPGAQPEIWSYGHRNPQGAAVDASGQIWVAEHGARGGDEVNRVEKGVNYGWPVISYGVNYDGSKIGSGTAQDGMAQPEFYWDPSIAPSGMTFVSGEMYADWQGDALVGSLKFAYISRLSGETLTEVEQLKVPDMGRVRDVDIGPDGAIWFLSVHEGALYRLTPAQ